MLETVREYGLERLAASDEAGTTRDRHAAWCLALAEEAAPKLTGAEQVRWLNRLELEHPNLRVALGWLEGSDPPAALRLAASLWFFWFVRSHLTEGRGWLERALAATREASVPSAVRAQALVGAGTLAHYQGDDERALELLAESLARWRERGDRWGIALALVQLGVVAEDAGDYDRAQGLLAEALAHSRSAPDPVSPAVAAAASDRDGMVAWVLYHLGVVRWGSGDPAGAAAAWEEALALLRRVGHTWGVATTAGYLGLLATDRGDLARAARLHRESLDLRWELGVKEDLAGALADIASLVVLDGSAEVAVRLFGAADALRATIGAPAKLPERATYEQATAAARRALADHAFAAAWDAGRALTLEQAVAAARDALAAAPRGMPADAVSAAASPLGPAADARATAGAAAAAGLTPRELEVLSLLVAGESTRSIAASLSIADRTAGTHIANILAKLGVESRAAAIARAFQLGLV